MKNHAEDPDMIRFYCEVEMHMRISSEESGIRCSLVCDILRTM